MEKWGTYIGAFSMSVLLVTMAACGGGGGGGDGYVVQELGLDLPGAPHAPLISSLAWDGTNFWVHSGVSGYDSLIYAFDTTGNQVDSIANPLYQTHRIYSMEYGDGSLWAMASPIMGLFDNMIFEITTGGAVASSFNPAGFEANLAYADSLVWIPEGDLFNLYEPSDGSLAGTVPGYSGNGDIVLLCEGGGFIWLFNSPFNPGDSFGFHKFDKTGVELDFYPLDEWGGAITWANGKLWMARAPARLDAYDFD